MQIIDKSWGEERIFVNSKELNLCLKKLVLTPEKRLYSSSLHFHNVKDEIFIIDRGEVKFSLLEDGHEVTSVLKKGDVVQLPRGTAHRFSLHSEESCEILEVSTYHSDEDVVRL